ncbi:MAG: type I-E CRISPR-associated protein Cas6/Cse3/CasE [Fimbriimonadaceae bacterium]|nr:type I-E CRISPR-associated protein Cas6/Cse3/CasE [Fimbriimonadaceae bacterium]
MILSRLVFNPLHAGAYKLADDPYGLHIRLCACAQKCRAEGAILYRWEEGPVLLVQSDGPLDWSKLELPPNALRGEPQSKPFDPSFRVGQRLTFRIRCRPCKKVKVEPGKNSRLRALRTEEARLDWLARQGHKAGFLVEHVEATQEVWQDTRPSQNEREDMSLRERVPATRFDGVLVVQNPEQLLAAVRQGIGPQKAYGFGMLSLGRAD